MEPRYRYNLKEQSNQDLTFPKVPNYEACSDYLMSKSVTRRYKPTVDGAIHQRDVSVGYHFAKKKLSNAEHKLKLKVELAAQKRISLDEQWEDLTKKEDDLRENFKFFNKFILENIEKRDRAQFRITSMNELNSKRKKEIQDLLNEYYQLKELKLNMDKSIAKYKIYENFLAKVVERYPSQFKTVADVLKRYEALRHAQTELLKLQNEDMNKLEDTFSICDKITAEKYVIIAGLQTKLSDMQRRYETAQTVCKKWENFHHVVVLETLDKIRQANEVKDACWQIYKDICERKSSPTVHKDDYAKQFETIKKTLLQHRLVNEKIDAMEVEKLRVSEKACASEGSD